MRVAFFGDSICMGQFVPPHVGWVARTTHRLESVVGGAYMAVNTSVAGNTTRLALERMPYDIQAHAVEYILVQFGMNDCNRWVSDRGVPRVSEAAFRANMHEIVDRAFLFGARRLFLSTNHPTPRTEEFEHVAVAYQECNERYNEIIRDVAAGTDHRGDVVLIDNEASWRVAIEAGTPLEELVLHDGIHLSPLGHDLYFETVSPIMVGVIEADLAERG